MTGKEEPAKEEQGEEGTAALAVAGLEHVRADHRETESGGGAPPADLRNYHVTSQS